MAGESNTALIRSRSFDTSTGNHQFELSPEVPGLLAFGESFAAIGDFAGSSQTDSLLVFDVATGQEVANLSLADFTNDHRHAASLAFRSGVVLVGVEGDSTVGGVAYVFHIPEPDTIAFLLIGVCQLARGLIRPARRHF